MCLLIMHTYVNNVTQLFESEKEPNKTIVNVTAELE